jgi:hypothetical protein
MPARAKGARALISAPALALACSTMPVAR